LKNALNNYNKALLLKPNDTNYKKIALQIEEQLVEMEGGGKEHE
jgi:hypothetical protein